MWHSTTCLVSPGHVYQQVRFPTPAVAWLSSCENTTRIIWRVTSKLYGKGSFTNYEPRNSVCDARHQLYLELPGLVMTLILVGPCDC